MRLDIALRERGLAPSREKARSLIDGGAVSVGGKIIKKSSFEVVETDEIIISGDTSELRYVSRGGLKLERALEQFEVDVRGKTAVDIGASTGGFTDCLLKNGAEKVIAVDCGTNQLHESLRRDERVLSIENFNARYLDAETVGGKHDIVVADVSFISQMLLYDAVTKVLKDGGIFISLIKPQFEAGKKYIGKNGIIKDEKIRSRIVANIIEKAAEYGFKCRGVIDSPIEGGDGNHEYLALFVYKKS